MDSGSKDPPCGGMEPGWRDGAWGLFSQGLLLRSQNTKSEVLYKHLIPTLWVPLSLKALGASGTLISSFALGGPGG